MVMFPLMAGALQGRFGGAAPWTPANLFASGEKGWFIEAYDLTTTFQDTSAATPATADTHRVALVLDKSPNGMNFRQTVDANRQTLNLDVHNGLAGITPSATTGRILTSILNMDSSYNSSFSLYGLVKRSGSGTFVWASHNSAVVYVSEISQSPLINTSQLSDTQISVANQGDVTLVSFRYDGATKRLAVYGVSGQASNSEAATGGSGLNFSAAPFALGALSTGSFPWPGHILASVGINRVLSDAEDTEVTNYFRQRAALNFP